MTLKAKRLRGGSLMKYQDGTAPLQASRWAHDAEKSALADAHINPDEAVMLLDMLSSAPEFRIDFLAWEPMSYREHFKLSHFKTRDVAIAAYDRADPDIRNSLDTLAVTMTIVLEATRAAMEDADGGPGTIAEVGGNALELV